MENPEELLQQATQQATQQDFADRCQKAQIEIQKVFEKFQVGLAPMIEMRDMKQGLIIPPAGTKTEK